MIITPQFVLLNCPKTGSTFVRTVLREIEQRRQRSLFERLLCKAKLKQRPFQELMLPNIKAKNRRHICDQHGTYRQIPERYRALPVVTVLRNPFDRYVSQYEFRWWADHPIDDPEIIRKKFPTFPDLSFRAFLDYKDFEGQRYKLTLIKPRIHLGHQTITFIQMYFENPEQTFSEIDDAYINTDTYKDALPDMHILRTESLNRDLYDFLLTMDYPEGEIAFILDRDKIQPPEGTSRKGQDWRDYYTPELIQKVYDRERLLFRIYADLGVGAPDCWPSVGTV